MTTQPISETAEPNLDQAAIADYFASEQFKRSCSTRLSEDEKAFRDEVRYDQRRGRLLRAWTLELEREDGLSMGIAFYGLGSCWLAIAIFVPHGVWMLGGFTNQVFGFWITLVQFTFAPMLMCLAMISVTSSMWYVSLAKRFATAIAILTPATLMLIFGLVQMSWIEWSDVWPRVPFLVISFCVASTAVTLPLQMWGGWSLSQAREMPRELPRLSTYQFLELTAIASVIFAVGVFVRDRSIWYEGLACTLISLLCTLAVTAMIVTRLNKLRRYRFIGFVIASVFGFTAMLIVSLFGFSRFEETMFWNNQAEQTFAILIASTIGAAIFVGTMQLATWWLHLCGWQCVKLNKVEGAAPSD
ncbi:hypothetical protein [Rubripirellula reticaptiva]|uniref:Uncharacterized protein n=1 Tax=Rubripirellula reticaptiva TaxID=2528013 RepID=A0A5C6EVL1_9BACT|nr:hypothetical protein [Rubripirellula reticaptiva]TWU51666.1 hypothetical protein Poly59_32600 [Rubripirellula reticaptiva]